MSELKTENIVYVSPEDDLHTLLTCFKINRISHVPVIREKKVVGMISKTDVVEALYTIMMERGSETFSEICKNTFAKSLMIQPTIQADVNAPESVILEKLMDHQVSSVVLQKNGQVVGIVTEKDMLLYLADKQQGKELSVTESMGLQVVEWMDKNGLMRLSRMLADIGI